MGYIQHDAVIVVTGTWRDGGVPDVEAFRASLPTEFQHLIVGPIPDNINGYVIFVMLPDGSKEGWPPSDTADEIREAFKDLFRQQHEDGSSTDNWVHVRFGGDHQDEVGNTIVEQWPVAEPFGDTGL